MCELNLGRVLGIPEPRVSSYTPPCPQWPYCEKRCSYCNFNKYIPRGVEEGAVRSCLVTEARTLLRLSGVQRSVPGTVGEVLGWERTRQADIPGDFHHARLRSLPPEWSQCSSVGEPRVWPVRTPWLPSWRPWHEKSTCLQIRKSLWRLTPPQPQGPGWQVLEQPESTGCPLVYR